MIQRDNPAPGNIKQVSQDELESFKKVRHIPMGDKFIPVLNVEVPLGNINFQLIPKISALSRCAGNPALSTKARKLRDL